MGVRNVSWGQEKGGVDGCLSHQRGRISRACHVGFSHFRDPLSPPGWKRRHRVFRQVTTLSPHFHKPLCCHLCQGQSGLTINLLTVHKILLRITLEHFIQVFVNVTIQSARWTIHCTSARTAITICTIGIVCTACRVLVQMEGQLPLWMVAATKNIQVITREYFDFFL